MKGYSCFSIVEVVVVVVTSPAWIRHQPTTRTTESPCSVERKGRLNYRVRITCLYTLYKDTRYEYTSVAQITTAHPYEFFFSDKRIVVIYCVDLLRINLSTEIYEFPSLFL